MSIKAGRVGVNPFQVNPVDGSIISSATSGYTKQEADAKFLTQTDAASTYESKSDASAAHNALQPKTLAVPISMLDGSKLTVETALQGLNDGKNVVVGVLSSLAGSDNNSQLRKQGSDVFLNLRLNNASAEANTPLAVLPSGFKPTTSVSCTVFNTTASSILRGYVDSDGGVKCGSAITASDIRIAVSFIL